MVSFHRQRPNPKSTTEDRRPTLMSLPHAAANEAIGVEEDDREDQPEILVGIDDSGSSPDALRKIVIETRVFNQGEVVQESKFQIPSGGGGLFSRVATPIPRTRLYQVWPGNNVFFFRGRFVCGPDPHGFLLTSVSIVLSDWIFCTYIDDSPRDRSVPIVAFSIILTVLVIVNLILASTRDPGIVPRSNSSPLGVSGSFGRTRSKRICIDGIETKLKYCRVCKIFRPPRSCHCTVCDNCVEKFDHHCPWVSQCIGARNYRQYMGFVLSAFVFFVYMFAFSCRRIRRKVAEARPGVLGVVADAPETLALALFSFFAIWFLGGLAIFHAYLITKNQTARENFKQRYAKSPNPYDKGLLGNIKEALFTRLPPSKVNFRAVVGTSCESLSATPIKIEGENEGDGAIMMQHASIPKEESPQKSGECEHSEVEQLETR